MRVSWRVYGSLLSLELLEERMVDFVNNARFHPKLFFFKHCDELFAVYQFDPGRHAFGFFTCISGESSRGK